MTIWIDAQISPIIALWINEQFDNLNAVSLRSLGLIKADDVEVFNKAKQQEVIIMSKDYDFVKLLRLHGPPPKLIWITTGNTSNAALNQILIKALPQALLLLSSGEIMVEIN